MKKLMLAMVAVACAACLPEKGMNMNAAKAAESLAGLKAAYETLVADGARQPQIAQFVQAEGVGKALDDLRKAVGIEKFAFHYGSDEGEAAKPEACGQATCARWFVLSVDKDVATNVDAEADEANGFEQGTVRYDAEGNMYYKAVNLVLLPANVQEQIGQAAAPAQ